MIAPGWDDVTRALDQYAHAGIDGAGPRAAVALVLREPAARSQVETTAPAADPLELLFIRRAEHDRDPWSGQVGFPGGRTEPQDDGVLATAVRETHEETGLDLAREARLLGRLDEVRALARGRPVDLVISPFVFRLLRPTDGTPSQEVVSLHWLPLATLLDPASRSLLEYSYDEKTLTLPCIDAGGLRIWGLTFRMFENFAAVLRASPTAES